MFRSDQLLASGSPSTACTMARGTSRAIDRAIAPDPVPRSTATGSATFIARSRSIAQPVITSVSGRGTKTPGPTSSSRYLKYAWPVMCCSGSRFSLRPMSTQNRASNSESGTVCSSPRLTWCTCAAMSSASARGDPTPASASRVVASAISSSSSLPGGRPPVPPGCAPDGSAIVSGARSLGSSAWLTPSSLLRQFRFQVGGGERVDYRVQVAVDHLVQVVCLVAHPVVVDAVLREVVGAHPFGPVDRADLRLALSARLRVCLFLGRGEQPGAQHAQRLLLVLQLALLILAGDHDPGRQVRDAHRRVGRVDGLAAGTAGTVDVDAQFVLVDLHVHRVCLRRHEHASGGGVDAAL